jgi:hypothetical protein
MTVVYEVRVERKVHDNETGEYLRSDVLFAAEGPDATRLYSFAPQQVELALAGEGPGPVPAAAPRALTEAWGKVRESFAAVDGAEIAEPAGEPQTVAHSHGQHGIHEHSATDYAEHQKPIDGEKFPASAQTEAAPKKRTRRTKAEIEADKAAALASQAGADPGPANEAAIAEAAAADPARTEKDALAAGLPVEMPAMPGPVAPPGGGDGKPWNPFKQA